MIEHVHPPKVETFDVLARTNTDNKGFVRPVHEYAATSFGLYMSREVEARPTADWIESWIIPRLGLRISRWSWKPGHAQDYDYYLDIVDVQNSPKLWSTKDLYLDITIQSRRESRILDIDEFAGAVAAGLISLTVATRALEISHGTMVALATHRNDLDSWLATEGIALTWRDMSGETR
jgi:hypothetical protein